MTTLTVTDHPEFSPGACFRCQAGDTRDQHGERMREYFVDLGIQFEWEGELYLCNKCIEDILEICPDKISLREYNETINQLIEYKELAARVENVKGKLISLGFDWEVLSDGTVLADSSRTIDVSIGTATEADGASSDDESEFVALDTGRLVLPGFA